MYAPALQSRAGVPSGGWAWWSLWSKLLLRLQRPGLPTPCLGQISWWGGRWQDCLRLEGAVFSRFQFLYPAVRLHPPNLVSRESPQGSVSLSWAPPGPSTRRRAGCLSQWTVQRASAEDPTGPVWMTGSAHAPDLEALGRLLFCWFCSLNEPPFPHL